MVHHCLYRYFADLAKVLNILAYVYCQMLSLLGIYPKPIMSNSS